MDILDKNIEDFLELNELEQGFDESIKYLTWIENRLNRCLILLNSENLCNLLGINYNELLAETRNLLSLSSQVHLPKAQIQNKL